MAATDNELRELLQVKPPNAGIDWINMLIYADPGVGKTYFGGTADDSELTRPVLFLDAEGGLATIRHRTSIDTKQIRSYKDLENIYNQLYHSLKDGKLYYKTIVLDSLTEFASVDMKDIMKEAYSRNPANVDIDVPSPREWGKSREHVRRFVRAFRDLPCNVIYTAHVGSVIEGENQPPKYFPGFSGKLKTEVPGFMDIVGYYSAKIEGGEVTRTLQFQATRRVVAKDRTDRLGQLLDNPTVPMIFDLIHS